MPDSEELYKELLEVAVPNLAEQISQQVLFPTQFKFSDKFNGDCYTRMYENQRRSPHIPRMRFWPVIQGLQLACEACWGFYLSPRDQSVKSLGITYGKSFEREFMRFLKTKGFECKRGDEEDLNYPDVQVLNRSGNPACYLEFKYLTAPFLMVDRKVGKDRQCYEGSTTLDCDEKLLAQRDRVENEIDVPVFYTYWIDYPCIKGIFYWDSDDVYSYVDSVGGLEFTRRERSGDYAETSGGTRKVGHIDKVYLPLMRMGSFEELMGELKQLTI